MMDYGPAQYPQSGPPKSAAAAPSPAEMNSGITLFFQQLTALLKKNVWLALRNKKTTLLLLVTPFIFMSILFFIDKANRAADSGRPKETDPPVLVSPAIPPCEEKFYIKQPCFDFIWSGDDGNSSSRISQIVSRIMANNPGRPIPPNKVKSFKTPKDVDTWFFNNGLKCPGALHFAERNSTVISYGIQTNSSALPRKGLYQDPTFKFHVPLQIAAEREIARTLIGDQNFGWTVGLKEFPHPAGPAPEDPTGELTSLLFLFTIAMFPFLFQISSIVLEKEMNLRQAMNIMGLFDSAYWLSWFVWETTMVLISSLLTVCAGMMFQIDCFLHNNFFLVFLTFFLYQLNMLAFAFMLSTLVQTSASAFRMGFWVFMLGSILQIMALTSRPDSKFTPWLFVPPELFGFAVRLLQVATSDGGPGISWSERSERFPTYPKFFTMNFLYMRLIIMFAVWLVLALYLDNVMPSTNGTSKPLLYFLNPGYWTGSGNKGGGGSGLCGTGVPLPEIVTPSDPDVLEEENCVKYQMSTGQVAPNIAVQIRGLIKSYPGKRVCKCCCKCHRTDPFHAVKGLFVNMVNDQCFCLLGPNGAGKTTTISCLTGVKATTAGDALICGNSIRSSVGMTNIRKMIGVCPQFDIQWAVLTGEEHLQLFGNIKGLPAASIDKVVKKALEEVKLSEKAKVRSGSYSGGMKRRLSVAAALMGDPRLVILDEPTTGMDPISRRYVWDIIANAKRGRVVILTTHSMEEVDVLGDRIGIMAKGRLRCIGTAIRLKARFGSGFVTNLKFMHSDAESNSMYKEEVKSFFFRNLGLSPKDESNAFLTFVIPRQQEGQLKGVLRELQDRQREFGIVDIQLSLTTLEEVFLNIARQAELESAAAEGRLVTLTLQSGALLKIPVGAKFVAIPGTDSPTYPRGMMVEVYWEQDGSGGLCITGHSSMIPVPYDAQTLPVAAPRIWEDPGVALGVVII